MIGDKYVVKNNCITSRLCKIKKGDILIEKGIYNTEKNHVEDAGEYNELVHNVYGYVCDAGSPFARTNLEKMTN